MISFANNQSSVKLRLACSKVLLLINYFVTDSEILLRTYSNGYIKGDKYLLFIKVGVANDLLKLNYLLSRHNTERSYL